MLAAVGELGRRLSNFGTAGGALSTFGEGGIGALTVAGGGGAATALVTLATGAADTLGALGLFCFFTIGFCFLALFSFGNFLGCSPAREARFFWRRLTFVSDFR